MVQVTQAGVATTLGSGGLFSATTNSVEVIEQPTNLILCSELGSSPQHLFTLDPVTTAVQTIHQSSGQFGFSDCEVLRSRPLWATNAWVVGSIGNLSLNFGAAAAGHVYRVALSLSATPGVPLGAAGVLHLAPDHLFTASVVIGAPLFNNFMGVLDGQGRATPNPFVNLPALPALRGIRVYAGAVAATNRGIAAISNCWGTTLQ